MSMFKLRDYQKEVVESIIDGGGTGVVAIDRGGGKTVTAAEIARRLGAEVIMVTAPLNTFSNWERTFRMTHPHLPVRTITSKTQDDVWPRAKAGEPGVYLIGWEYGIGSVRYKKHPDGTTVTEGRNKRKVVDRVIREPIDWSLVPLDIAIVDESARMGGSGAKQSQQTSVVWSSKGAPHKLALSATPAGNRIERIWYTLHWLWPDRFRHYWPFVDRFLTKKLTPFGMVVEGERRPGSVARAIPVYERRTEGEIHTQLPEVVEHLVEVDMTAKQRKIYDQFYSQSLAWLEDRPVTAEVPAVQYMRLLQVCLAVPVVGDDDRVTFAEPTKSSKLDALVDILQDIPEDEPVLVWTHSKQFVGAVVERLRRKGHKVAAAYGGQSMGERQDALENFGKPDGHRILVATVPAVGEGTDGLQHVCATEVWLSQDESVMLNQQAEGRLRRPGQSRTINRYRIGAKNTVETKKTDRLARNKAALVGSGMM